MNISYTGLKLEDYSDEVIRKYKFPNSNELERFLNREQTLTVQQHKSAIKLAQQDFFAVAGLLSVGSLSYIFYNSVGGKVIRDRIRASMPFPKRVLVQVLPFVALGTALIISRRGIEGHNHGYKQ
uniref:NDUTT17 n=1 Tax=Tetrahymena thermophila (strain SB210) TaxID=312017 RepID=UPI002549C1C8|nr:Chain TH, NDUTT17 [Tetrahymena thermophila SB210]8GYM_th Chain th, NDUTT17 [Tetrahymena thermophila SB210]8GZU_TH Chain TH, NDUTT17 [Tetrahymena thermophila SB210]8GZU_th Chain th, NDUTT17 [Tetrahymena thermophila SB210]